MVKRSTLVACVAAALAALVACSSATTTAVKTSRPKPTPTQNAVAVTFNGCGAATYAEPTPPQPTPATASFNPHPSTSRPPAWTPPPPTDTDILSFVHQTLSHDPSVSHGTVTCGIKHFAASDLADYLHGTSVKGDVVVVAAHVQPSSGKVGQDRVILLTSSRPVAIYLIDIYSADLIPDVFKGI